MRPAIRSPKWETLDEIVSWDKAQFVDAVSLSFRLSITDELALVKVFIPSSVTKFEPDVQLFHTISLSLLYFT